MAEHELHRLETIDWYTYTRGNPENVDQYWVTLIGYFTKSRCDELERVFKARWNKFNHSVVVPRGLGIGEFMPVIMFDDESYSAASASDSVIHYVEGSDDAVCTQIPLPMDLITPLERTILLAESLKTPSINDEQRRALQCELSDAEPRSGWDRYETKDSMGRLVGYPEGRYILRKWGLDRIKYNHANDRVSLNVALDDRERLEIIRSQLNRDSSSFTKEQRNTLVTERSRLRRLIKYPPMNWRELFRTAREHLDSGVHDFRVVAGVFSYLRRHMDDSDSKPLVRRLNSIFNKEGMSTVELDGDRLTVDELVALVSEGDKGAEKAVIALLVSAYAPKNAGARAVDLSTANGYFSDQHTEDQIPDWAKPEKSFIEKWAETTRGMGQQGTDGEIGRAVADKVGKGEVNVLIFDSELYQEVITADMVGDPTGGVVEFPFPLAIVPLLGIPDIYGVVVYSWDELPSRTAGRVRDAGSYGIAYLLSGGGVTTNPGRRALDVGDKLVTYLDCESVQFDTAYVDAGASHVRAKSTKSEHAETSKQVAYVKGSDFTTGTRIVVERDRSKERADGKKAIRRSHFRRGYFRRQRIGSHDSWHYETRWIKPTFVHGSQTAITERKVRRIVL